MPLDPSIILAGNQLNAIGALSAGQQAGQLQRQTGERNALQGFIQQRGADVLAGDRGAVNSLANYGIEGLNAAQGVQSNQRQMEVLNAQEARAIEAHALKMSSAERAAEAARIEEGVRMGLMINSPEEWDAMAAQNAPELVGKFAQRDQLAAKFMATADVLKMVNPEQEKPLSNAGKFAYDQQRGLIPEGVTGEGTEYGLTPQFIVGENDEIAMVQLAKDGTAKIVQLPEGYAASKGIDKLDLGDSFQWVNNFTGERIGEPVPKNLAEAERQKAAGKAEGENKAEAVANLGGVVAKAEQGLALIDDIINDPALAGITGMVQGRMPPLTQAGTDLNVKIEQLKGKTFLEAFESLKGGGQITEREGAAAQAAMARMDRAQSTEAYIAALNELADIMRTGLARAQQKAGVTPGSTTTSQSGAIPVETKKQILSTLSDEEISAVRAMGPEEREQFFAERAQ